MENFKDNSPSGGTSPLGRRKFLTIAGMGMMALPFLSSIASACMNPGSDKTSPAGTADNLSGSAEQKQETKLRIGVIGAGWLGGTVGKLLVKAGHEVMFSSRHPEELKPMVAELGARASVGTPREAAEFGTVLLFAVPYDAIPQLGIDLKDAIKGKVVLDACNGGSGELAKEVEANGQGETSAKYLAGSRLVRAFSCVDATQIEASASRSSGKMGVPIAGDDQQALDIAAQLVRDAGCDPVITGKLATAVKFQRGTVAFRVHKTAPELRRILGLAQEK